MITDTRISEIQKKIKLALLKIETEENVKISFESARYTKAFYKTSMIVKTNDISDDVKDVYVRMCKMLGLTQNIIGMTFTGKNGLYEIIDIVPKNRKYPIIAKSLSVNKEFKYTVDQIKRLIGGDKIINRNANLDKLVGDK